MLKFKSWHVFLFRRGWSSKAGVWNSRHLEANYWKGLMSHRGMQPRLVNPPILTTRQLYLVFCDMFSGGCAWGCVMCPFFAYKHLSCKTIQISEWLHIRKAALVILHCYMHGRSACHDWMEFWFSLYWSKWSPLNVSLHIVSSTEKCLPAEKCHLNLTFCRKWWKLSTTLKYVPLTHVCSCSSVRKWMHSTNVFSYTQK